jgi:hypothetical protein
MNTKGCIKTSARVLLGFASLFIAYLVTRYAASFTGAPLGDRGKEATPVTVVVIYTVFPLSLAIVLLIGNLLINRYFRTQNLK